jgi:hypothetical protein
MEKEGRGMEKDGRAGTWEGRWSRDIGKEGRAETWRMKVEQEVENYGKSEIRVEKNVRTGTGEDR